VNTAPTSAGSTNPRPRTRTQPRAATTSREASRWWCTHWVASPGFLPSQRVASPTVDPRSAAKPGRGPTRVLLTRPPAAVPTPPSTHTTGTRPLGHRHLRPVPTRGRPGRCPWDEDWPHGGQHRGSQRAREAVGSIHLRGCRMRSGHSIPFCCNNTRLARPSPRSSTVSPGG
jgi:hypothetical protein